jgi:predicted SprT family Zn-dependent metalloprotease
MRLFKQLEFIFRDIDALTSILSLRERRTTKSPGEGHDLEGGTRCPERVAKTYAPSAPQLTSPSEGPIHLSGRDHALEATARSLLRQLGAAKLAREVRVEWNPRLKTAAGRADYRETLISLNPLLLEHDVISVNRQSGSDIDRTLRHELAHLLAQFRVGRRRIAPHGPEWREACRDLGIADEARCHNLPFATRAYPACFVYRCPNCRQEFPRARRVRRAIACLACCRKHNGGDFDPRFRLRLIAHC